MQPIDYTFKAPDPGQAFMASLMAVQQQRAAQAAAEQAAAEKAEQQQVLSDLASKPNATAQDYARVMTRYPGLAEPLKKASDALAPEIKQARISLGYQALSAVRSGKPEIAVKLLNSQAEAARGSGDEQNAKGYETWAKLIELDPQGAGTSVGLMLAGIDDKFADNFAKIGGETRAQAQAPAALREAEAKATKAEAEAVTAGAAAAVAPDSERIRLQGDLIDQEYKREASRLRAIEVQLGKETNDLKRQELQQKLEEGRSALATKRAERKSEADLTMLRIQDNLGIIQEIKDLGGVGWMTAANRNLPFTDSKAIAAKLDQLKGQLTFENLKAMAGGANISNADMLAVEKAVSSISLLQKPEQTMKEINKLESFFKRALSKTREKYGADSEYNPAATSPDPRVHQLMTRAGMSESEAVEFLKSRK